MMAFAPNEYSHRFIPQNIPDLIEHALLLARKDYFQSIALGIQNIDLRVSIEPALPPVICQAWKITQSFFAIIRNAAEAIVLQRGTNPGGVIDIIRKAR